MQEVTEVETHYDELDLAYRKIWGRHLHHGIWTAGARTHAEAGQALLELVIERLQPRRGQPICDVGCGDGHVAVELAERFGVAATGITLSGRQAERARVPDGLAVSIVRKDWLKNDLAPESFDAVVAIESLAHMPSPGLALQEIARVLRPGGRVCLCCWLKLETALPWESRFLLNPICRDGRLFGMGTQEEVCRWIEGAGLQCENFEDLSEQVESTWPRAMARALGLFLRDSEFRGFVKRHVRRSGGLALTLLRIATAYRLGAMRYVIFTISKPR